MLNLNGNFFAETQGQKEGWKFFVLYKYLFLFIFFHSSSICFFLECWRHWYTETING